MGLILKPTLSPLPHTAVGSTLPGHTGQQRTDCLRAFTIASWLLLGLNHGTDTVGCCCGKRHQQKFLCSIECLKHPAVDDKFMLRLWGCLQWPSWFCLSRRVIQLFITNITWGQLVFHWSWNDKILRCTERLCGAWPWAEISCRDANVPPACKKNSVCVQIN